MTLFGRNDALVQQPTTQTMKISTVRAELNSLVNQVYRKETRVVVEKSGIPVAALVSTDDLERLDQLDRERAARFAILDEFRAAFKDVPPEELELEAERALAEVRAEMRAERAQVDTPHR
jgi:prevent-host-death family protein